MKGRLCVLVASLVLVACGEPVSPNSGDALATILAGPNPAGTWRYDGAQVHFSAIQFHSERLIDGTEVILQDGTADGYLRCAVGATTYAFPDGTTAPCHITGSVYGKQTSANSIEFHLSFREAPVAVVGTATINGAATVMTATVQVNVNVTRGSNEALTFNRQP